LKHKPVFFDRLLGVILYPAEEKYYPWLAPAWLVSLFASGLWLWGKFLNWGQIPFDFHDWAEVNAPRMAFVRDAVLKGVLPLHMPDSSALRGITDRFMAIPDVILSPQVLLLRFLEVGPFILVNTLLFYALGTWGLLWFRRRFRLGLVPFSVLFFLFNFNGHILCHYSIGHITWAGYFLFPWIFVLVFKLLDGERGWAWSAKMAMLLFAIYIQGSFHHFVWVLLFLGLLAVTSWRTFWPVLKAGVFAVLLSTVRILPPVLLLNQFDDEFLGGYPTLVDILSSFVVIRFPAESLEIRSMFSNLGWWEYSLYLGAAGTAFLFFFGIYRWLKTHDPASGYPELLLPIAGVALLSLGRIYRLVRLVPIPLLSGERASIRMMILPVVILLVLAAAEFQSWLNERRIDWRAKAALLGLFVALVHDLWQNLKAWQVSNAFTAFPTTPTDLAIKVIANHPDPQYTTIIAIGAGVSLAALVILLALVWQEKNNQKKSQ